MVFDILSTVGVKGWDSVGIPHLRNTFRIPEYPRNTAFFSYSVFRWSAKHRYSVFRYREMQSTDRIPYSAFSYMAYSVFRGVFRIPNHPYLVSCTIDTIIKVIKCEIWVFIAEVDQIAGRRKHQARSATPTHRNNICIKFTAYTRKPLPFRSLVSIILNNDRLISLRSAFSPYILESFD